MIIEKVILRLLDLLPNLLFVDSDFGSDSLGLANNTPDTIHFTLNGGELSVTFNDKGDAAAPIPDTGSTLGLLFSP